jgi:hypothetical protein
VTQFLLHPEGLALRVHDKGDIGLRLLIKSQPEERISQEEGQHQKTDKDEVRRGLFLSHDGSFLLLASAFVGRIFSLLAL